MSLASAVDALANGSHTDADIEAIRAAFTRYIDSDDTQLTVLSEGCPQGLRTAIRNLRRKRHLHQAIAEIESPLCSVKSIADRIASDCTRLATRARPRCNYETYLKKAIDSHPGAAITPEALWFIVRDYRNSK